MCQKTIISVYGNLYVLGLPGDAAERIFEILPGLEVEALVEGGGHEKKILEVVADRAEDVVGLEKPMLDEVLDGVLGEAVVERVEGHLLEEALVAEVLVDVALETISPRADAPAVPAECRARRESAP